MYTVYLYHLSTKHYLLAAFFRTCKSLNENTSIACIISFRHKQSLVSSWKHFYVGSFVLYYVHFILIKLVTRG